ncbi:MAG: hypothetical protein B7X84_08010, partial [Alphaproteobacteria bacterium 17-39-52]
MTKKHFFKNILFISLSLLMVTAVFETWGMDLKRPDESEERQQAIKKQRGMPAAAAAERSPDHSDKEDSPSLRISLPDFADPTRDTAFKHLLSVSLDGHDPSIASSF